MYDDMLCVWWWVRAVDRWGEGGGGGGGGGGSMDPQNPPLNPPLVCVHCKYKIVVLANY